MKGSYFSVIVFLFALACTRQNKVEIAIRNSSKYVVDSVVASVGGLNKTSIKDLKPVSTSSIFLDFNKVPPTDGLMTLTVFMDKKKKNVSYYYSNGTPLKNLYYIKWSVFKKFLKKGFSVKIMELIF